MKFHVAHIIPDPRLHGLNGYKEVIETVIWGLEQLGHKVTYSVNRLSADARNIVFGGQMLSLEAQKDLKDDTIIYNFEQLNHLDSTTVRPEIKSYLTRFQIWDYSEFNLDFWSRLGPKYNVRIAPVGFAPILERISKATKQDIDVLIYGLTNELRLNAFNALAKAGLSTVFVCGLYGTARDELISRSKIIANFSLYTEAQIFEIVRVSYLLANRKAVVAHKEAKTRIESDIGSAVKFSATITFLQDVVDLIQNDGKRRELEERGYETIKKRDIKSILVRALE